MPDTSFSWAVFGRRATLPDISAIYLVVDGNDVIIYVGRARKLRTRWCQHHRKAQMRPEYRIYWLYVEPQHLKRIEKLTISICRPRWISFRF